MKTNYTIRAIELEAPGKVKITVRLEAINTIALAPAEPERGLKPGISINISGRAKPWVYEGDDAPAIYERISKSFDHL